LIIHISYSHS